MIILVLTIDGITQPKGFTALKSLCDYYKVSYSSAYKCKEGWRSKRVDYFVSEIEVIKIKGRNNNFSKKKNEYT